MQAASQFAQMPLRSALADESKEPRGFGIAKTMCNNQLNPNSLVNIVVEGHLSVHTRSYSVIIIIILYITSRLFAFLSFLHLLLRLGDVVQIQYFAGNPHINQQPNLRNKLVHHCCVGHR